MSGSDDQPSGAIQYVAGNKESALDAAKGACQLAKRLHHDVTLVYKGGETRVTERSTVSNTKKLAELHAKHK